MVGHYVSPEERSGTFVRRPSEDFRKVDTGILGCFDTIF
jgi:hypothetical protein